MMTHIANYIGLTESAEGTLVNCFAKISSQHMFETDVVEMCAKFTRWSDQHLDAIGKLSAMFEKEKEDEPGQAADASFPNLRLGPFGLLRDLHNLSVLIHEAHLCWTILLQAAKALRNTEMEMICLECEDHLKKESMWVATKIKNTTPQVLVVG